METTVESCCATTTTSRKALPRTFRERTLFPLPHNHNNSNNNIHNQHFVSHLLSMQLSHQNISPINTNIIHRCSYQHIFKQYINTSSQQQLTETNETNGLLQYIYYSNNNNDQENKPLMTAVRQYILIYIHVFCA